MRSRVHSCLSALAVLSVIVVAPASAQVCPYSVTFTPMNINPGWYSMFTAAFDPSTCTATVQFHCACEQGCWDLAIACTDNYVVASAQAVNWSIAGWGIWGAPGTLFVAPDQIISLGSASVLSVRLTTPWGLAPAWPLLTSPAWRR